MAMASQGVSRLAQMQMRFQQKQQIEREQRRVELQTNVRAASQDSLDASFNDTVPNAQNGKVRQMFDERRRGAGIDRSHPLKPIATTSTKVRGGMTTTTMTTSTAATVTNGRRTRPFVQAQTDFSRSTTSLNATTTTAATTMTTGQLRQRMTNGNAARTNNATRMNCNDAVVNAVSSLSLNDSNNNNPGSLRTKSTRAAAKLNPVITKKSPVVGRLSSTTTSSRSVGDSASKSRTVSGNLSSPVANNNKTTTKSSVKKISMSVKPPPREISTPPEGTSKCKLCGRTFNNDRLAKHEKVCQKMAITKRKIFDASKQRVKGTESEKFVKKRGVPQRSTSNYSSAAQTFGLNTGVKKNNWRIKHEDFIKTIRAAKQMQAHLARGGKLSDLPPPPPSENPDYIQCPHCGRRFNQQAAERHIPKCATMVHNKPKPAARNARR